MGELVLDLTSWKPFFELLAAVANVLTIGASGLAIALYLLNRKKISAALKLLLTFSFQTTLAELKEKLERLNEYNANEPDHIPEIRAILQEIAGQIRGNGKLATPLSSIATKIEALAVRSRLTEPSKRAIVSETREQIRNIQVTSIEIVENDHE